MNDALPTMIEERILARAQLAILDIQIRLRDATLQRDRIIAEIVGILVATFLIGLLMLEHAKGGPL